MTRLYFILLMLLVGCNSADFRSQTGKKRASQENPQTNTQDDNSPNTTSDDDTAIRENKNKPFDIGVEGDRGLNRDRPGPKKGTDEVEHNEVIKLTCNNSAGAEITIDASNGAAIESVQGSSAPGATSLPVLPARGAPFESKVAVTVEGEICPNQTNDLSILFVIDMSGSMGTHIRDRGPDKGQVHPGFDPQQNGTCGRLQAAQAILDKIKNTMSATDRVRVGLLPFAGGVISQKVVAMKDIESFNQDLNKDAFCQYVVQNSQYGYDPSNPGGISSVVGSGTNYSAAFSAAGDMLAASYGKKAVYFISDGQPTTGGSDPVQSGIAEGQKLRNRVDNLTLNGIILGESNQEARSVLEGVSGSANRVRDVASATDLANEITQFPELSILSQSARAILAVLPYKVEDIGLQFFGKNNDQPIWTYKSQPFYLVGNPNVETINTLRVTATGSNGSTHQAIVRIRYRR